MPARTPPPAAPGPTDTVPAMLTPGEYVIKRDAVRRIGVENLNRLNQGVRGYQGGGTVTQDPPPEEHPPPGMAPGLGTTGGAPVKLPGSMPDDFPAKPIKAAEQDKGPPAGFPAKPIQTQKPADTQAGPPASFPAEPIKPSETQAAQQPTPMPSGTGAAAPQGAPAPPPLTVPIPTPESTEAPDPHSQIENLIAQGKSAGEAQAIAAGQQPKTLAGKTPAPKPSPTPVETTTPPDKTATAGDDEGDDTTPPPAKPEVTAPETPTKPSQSTAGVTPKAAAFNVDTGQWDLIMPDGSTQHLPLDAYNGTGPIPGTPSTSTSTTTTTDQPKTVQGGNIKGTATSFGLNYDGTHDADDNGVGFFGGVNTRNPKLKAVAVPVDVLEATFGKFTQKLPNGTYAALKTPEAQKIIQTIMSAHVEALGLDGKVHKFPIVDIQGSLGHHPGKVLDLTPAAGRELGFNDNHSVSYQIAGSDGKLYEIDPDKLANWNKGSADTASSGKGSGKGTGGDALVPLPPPTGGSPEPARAQTPEIASGQGHISQGSQASASDAGGSGGLGGLLGLFGAFGGGGGEEGAGPQQPPRQSMQVSAPLPGEEQSPMVAALMQRGFTQQQAQQFALSSQNIAPGKGIGPYQPPAAPGAPGQPLVTPKLLSPKQLMPGKAPAIVPPKQPPAAPGARPQLPAPQQQPQAAPRPQQPVPQRPPQQPAAQQPKQQPAPQQPATRTPPSAPGKAPAPQPPPQPSREPTAFGRPPGSTHGDPNPPGMEDLTGNLDQMKKQHAALLSPDDPRVRRQADGYIKGEHFVPGDQFHARLIGGLPEGAQGRQRQLLSEAEEAIAEKRPMHVSYLSAPKEAEKFPTRDSRKFQYDQHSPEARLMGTTEGQLVGHSLIPLSVGVKLGKGGEPHQSYIQGISTNVMANNFQHLNDKLTAMGRESPYKTMGAKFTNDLEGYLHNLNAGHTATGRGYAIGTDTHPNEPDREHVPYKLTRKEADFINAVINNTGAFAKHEDAQAIRELAKANGTLVSEKGETNRMLHDIEQQDPGWSGRGSGKQGRVLEPSVRTFKTGLIMAHHRKEEHLGEAIRPGKEYQNLTKAVARTSEQGRPDVPIAASLHHTFADNRKINEIERDFSDHKISELEARARLKDLGEDPGDYRFVGGSGGLITPYEDDPEALTPEEHTAMKDNLRKQWVGGKLGVEDYRKKAAEVPLPSKPSQPKPVATEPGEPAETPEEAPAPKPIVPVKPKPKPPKPQPQPVDTEPAETPETAPAAPSGPVQAPKPKPKPKASQEAPAPDEPLPEKAPAKQIEPSRVKNSYAASGDKVHWLPTDEVDKRWQKDEGFHIPPGGTKNTIGQRYENAKEYIQGDQPFNAPRAHVDESGKISLIDGRHRLAAMRDLGHEKVPLALVDDAQENAEKTGLTPKATAPAPDEPLPPVKPKAAKVVKAPETPKPTAALEKPSWKTANEKTRQAYLKQRVAQDLEKQYKGADAHPLEVDRNDDKSIKYDPSGNPIYKKIDYDLANSPLLKKKGLNQIKDADKHEDTLGNLIGPDGKEVIDPETGQPVLKHAHLNQTERRRLSAMHTASAVHTMGDKIVDEFMKIKDIPEIAAGEGWYSRMREKLASALGEHHELFAQLLGATSAKTPVRNNFIQSLDALEQYKNGKFDNHIKKYLEGYEKMREGKGALVAHMKNLGIPLYDKDGNTVDTHENDAAAMANWIHHHGILPRQQIQEGQTEGSKYNANSIAVLKALAGTWLKEVGAPKTPNFAGNLTGRTLEATIDVWAARFLKRLGYEGQAKGPWRSQGKSEPGVNSLDFAFSQDAMRHAADEITKRTGKKMNPDDLQAIAWFAEKHHWEKQGWTRGAGAEKSSFDDVADLAFPKTGEPMTSADLRKHYGALQEEAKRVKARVKTAKGQAARGDPKLAAYMEKHGLTHEQVHGPEVEEEDEDEAA